LRAGVLAELGRYQEAVSSYDKAIEIDPIQASYWLDRGGALNEIDRREGANASFAKAFVRVKLQASKFLIEINDDT
jgi:tetratricopeptide (TPR) repeat protein